MNWPIAVPLGQLGGFSVTYPNVDQNTLGAVRHYQHTLGTNFPGWMSRMEFDPVRHGLTVHVFPATEIPQIAFHHHGYNARW